jgi:hypothetical protein
MSTIQEAFDIAATHLLRQGERSTASQHGGICAYRGYEGLKCGIGALISDESYTMYIEGHNLSNDDVVSAVRDSGWPVNESAMRMYVGIQRIHDGEHLGAWINELELLASNCDLGTDALTGFEA